MSNLVKDPIKVKIFVLVILFIIVALSILGSKSLMEKVIDFYTRNSDNAQALLDLNQIVYRNLLMIQRDLDLLVTSAGHPEISTACNERLAASFNAANEVINTIEYGGSYDYNYFDTFSSNAPATRPVFYTPNEKIQTASYIDTVTGYLIKLQKQENDIYSLIDQSDFNSLTKNQSKYTKSSLNIVNEALNTVTEFHRQVMNEVIAISQEKMDQLDYYNLIRYVGLLIIGLISLIIFIITVVQISNIIAERNKTMSDLDDLNHSLLKELEVAENVQAYLKPQWLLLDSKLVFSATYTPSKKIGGDFSDTLSISEDKYVTYVGDISSHGVQAALIMSAVKATINMVIEAEKDNLQPHYIIKRVNNIISKELFPNNYLTLLICLIDITRGTIRYYNAGQPPLIQYNRITGKARIIYEKSSVPIGWRSDYLYSEDEENEIEFNEDLVTFIFSDGIYQCQDANKHQLDLESFAQFIVDNYDHERKVILSHLFKHDLIQNGYAINADDFTLVSFWKRPLVNEFITEFLLMRSLLTNTKDIGMFCEKFILENQDNNVELAMQVELIVNEFLNNIIVHGLNSKSDTVILLKIEIREEMVLTFWDKGVTWDIPDKKPGEDPFAGKNDLDTSGRGIPIIYSLTSQVTRRRYEEVNETVMFIPLKDNLLQFQESED
ncbi:MAG: SpoIIE family protein phosphatase [Candidatus Cloacimonetes bacterium]|nr:SpoIIE family protein phosphatase [Candidatus Cloacimonadota bacterium]